MAPAPLKKSSPCFVSREGLPERNLFDAPKTGESTNLPSENPRRWMTPSSRSFPGRASTVSPFFPVQAPRFPQRPPSLQSSEERRQRKELIHSLSYSNIYI